MYVGVGVFQKPICCYLIGNYYILRHVLHLFRFGRHVFCRFAIVKWEVMSRISVLASYDWQDERILKDFLDHFINLQYCIDMLQGVKLAGLIGDDISGHNDHVDFLVLSHQLFL